VVVMFGKSQEAASARGTARKGMATKRHKKHKSFCAFCAFLWLFNWLDRYKSAGAAFIFKPHDAGNFREQRVILADADIQAGLEFRSTLADENRSSGHQFAAKTLDAEPL